MIRHSPPDEHTEKINITPELNRVLVYGKYTGVYNSVYNDWLILVHHIDVSLGTRDGDILIYRLASYDIKQQRLLSDTHPSNWGNLENYEFYKATEEDKKFMAHLLSTQHRKKYNKPLNILVER